MASVGAAASPGDTRTVIVCVKVLLSVDTPVDRTAVSVAVAAKVRLKVPVKFDAGVMVRLASVQPDMSTLVCLRLK